MTDLGKLERMGHYAIIDAIRVWLPLKLPDSQGKNCQTTESTKCTNNPCPHSSAETSILRNYILWRLHLTDGRDRELGQDYLSWATREKDSVVTFVWSTFSALEAKTWAQTTFLWVKDSLPLIELCPAWLICVYSHSSCKRSLPSSRGARLHVMELQSDPSLLQPSSSPGLPQA